MHSESSFPMQHQEECVRGIESMQKLLIEDSCGCFIVVWNISHIPEAAVLIFHTYVCLPVNTSALYWLT